MTRLRKLVILVHRYLGIPMSIVFVVWFASGIVMMYAGGMPSLSPEERLARLPALDLSSVALSPAQAAAVTSVRGGAVTLQSVLGRPAYRFGGLGPATTVFADTGEVLETISGDTARGEAARFVNQPEHAVSLVRKVTAPDQWTLTERGNLPLYQFAVDDGTGTHVYVSERSGDVTLMTNTTSRMLAWLGTIPHWFYFTPLRTNQPLWYWSVVYISALGCVLVALGLVLGVTQFRRSKPFRLSASVRYRGWMRWHYFTGAIFGLVALTWTFSGLLSMEPFAWTNATGLAISRDVFTGGPLELERYPGFDDERWEPLLGAREAKEIELVRIQDDPYFVVEATGAAGSSERERQHRPYSPDSSDVSTQMLVDARTLTPRREPFATATLIERLRSAADAKIETYELLSEYDSYYYSRAGGAPLPVLRVKFDDPAETWLYIDPARSQIVGGTHRFARLERWLFSGLHSLDFAFWYDKRPLWDIGMIVLSIGALSTSLIGMFLGFKRLGIRPSRRGRSKEVSQ